MKSDPLMLTREDVVKMRAKYGPNSFCHVKCRVCGSEHWNLLINLATLRTQIACAKCERPVEHFVTLPEI